MRKYLDPDLIWPQVAGLNALFVVDAKLTRIGLSDNDIDGKVAFIFIYCSLMISIAIAVNDYLIKSWIYSTVLATTIICSFVLFRLIGSFMVGEVTNVQLSFILVEMMESGVGIYLLSKWKLTDSE